MPHYKLTSPSGKIYHGITTQSVRRRMTGHKTWARNGSKLPLHNAIRKYGFENFKLEILSETCDRDELCRLEIEAITRDNSLAPNGYNVTAGGDGTTGHVVSDEHKIAIGKRMSERWNDPNFSEMKRANSSETISRLNADPEHKAKLQAASRAYWSNPENVAKRTEKVRALRESEPERFANQSVGLLKYNVSDAGRKKSRDTATALRARQSVERRKEISAIAVKARAEKRAERDAYLATLPKEEADRIRAEAKAKRSAETKAGRARATPEQKAASSERYRQAALKRHAAKKGLI